MLDKAELFRKKNKHFISNQIFAMDIGGSLTKIAYYSILPLKKIVYDVEPETTETVDDDAVYEVTEGARLHFIKVNSAWHHFL